MNTASIRRLTPLLSLAAALLSSCAGTAPGAKFTQQLPPEARIGREDRATAQVTAAPGVPMVQADCLRLGEKITRKIQATAQSRGGAARSYELTVVISRYEKGSAFARAMLAGLGQIHLDGTVSVFQLPGRTKVGEFKMSKTFAWGGYYGMATTMDTIEDTYAEGVAAAVCAGKP